MISMEFNEMRKIHTKVMNNNARDLKNHKYCLLKYLTK